MYDGGCHLSKIALKNNGSMMSLRYRALMRDKSRCFNLIFLITLSERQALTKRNIGTNLQQQSLAQSFVQLVVKCGWLIHQCAFGLFSKHGSVVSTLTGRQSIEVTLVENLSQRIVRMEGLPCLFIK
jgi:hypothetical protein